MPMGEDGSWRPGTREDQRREAAARGDDFVVRLLRWSSPVFAVIFWAGVLLGVRHGRTWFDDGLIWYALSASVWTFMAIASLWTHLRARARRT
ncbi:hypothetical protein BJF80_09220 [Serinicoccus sp. CUA-874]|uniref:hypothetical protein n=1 Tax=Serinicoccus sp. CUA-874 TaxID=1517939 RepID=UPI00095DE55F|nr:hypothetical protein [Serinicoccus sp. CUA-874]OLT15577.1 hypothetical protein BJF80_09220 [Serinicoccus sp. CUA-874]